MSMGPYASRGREDERPDPPPEPAASSLAEPGGLVLQNQQNTQDLQNGRAVSLQLFR